MQVSKRLIVEEVFNSVTHGIGTLFCIAGLIVLLTYAQNESTIKVISFSIFGISLILLYLFSTLFHSLTFTKAKRVFHVLDRSAIFLLIAGTYTPLVLVTIQNVTGWLLLSFIWCLSITGIVLNAVFQDRVKFFAVPIYLLMGWIGVILVQPIIVATSINIFFLLVLGGVFYTVGTIFYGNKRLPFSHSIWHLFVIAGSICHFVTILRL